MVTSLRHTDNLFIRCSSVHEMPDSGRNKAMMLIPTCRSAHVKATSDVFFLVGYVEERLWWPIQSSNIGGKKKASS